MATATSSSEKSTRATIAGQRRTSVPTRARLSLHTAHPAAFSADPEAEYSPLEAPALPFSSRRSRSRPRSADSLGRESGADYHTRPTSSPSLPSLTLSPSASFTSTPHSTSTDSIQSIASRRDMHGRGLSDAQEELLVEANDDHVDGKDGMNPYAWERPLDAVQRHSRMLDSSPLASTTADPTGRRVSRLPPGVQMLDPFGFSLAADASPYDLALNASAPVAAPGIAAPARNSVRASFLQPQLTVNSISSSSRHPSSSSIASHLSQTSAAAAGTPPTQPWTKPRSASAGEVYQTTNRAQIRSGLLAAPPQVQRGTSARSRLSKLSGEIDIESLSAPVTPSQTPLPAFVPADSDYLNSKLYARTLKAQKALEKERLKAASKGKMSRYDSEAARSTSSLAVPRSSTDTGRPASIFSVASAGKIRTGRRSALGWFKSPSEAALSPPTPDPPSPSPPLPKSRSSSALPLETTASSSSSPLPPSPNLASDLASRSVNSSSDYLREARESVAAHKAPYLGSRQTSASSGSSSGGEEPRSRHVPMLSRPARQSPAASFQQTPTIREASPPPTPADERGTFTIPALVDPVTAPATLPPSVAPVNPPLPARTSSSSPTRPERSSHQASSSSHAPPQRIAESAIPFPPPSSDTAKSRQATSAIPSDLASPQDSFSTARSIPLDAPQQGTPSLAPPTSRSSPTKIGPTSVKPDAIPFPAAKENTDASKTLAVRTSPRKPRPSETANVVPPPLLSPDASLANGGEVGVKRRKSSLGLLFGSGGAASKSGKNSPSTSPVASRHGLIASKEAERHKMVRKMQEKPNEAPKPVTKDKVKEKVKESFFGRVKRPEIPEPKTVASPAPNPSVPPARQPVPEAIPARSRVPPRSGQAPSLPPGAQPPNPQYSSVPLSSVSTPSRRAGSNHDRTGRAPDSSSSASTELSTLSSSSSTLPSTASSSTTSANGTNVLSKSINGTPKSGGGMFSSFFGRHRTKSLGPATPKATRSKNTTPTPEEQRSQLAVLPSNRDYERRSNNKKLARGDPARQTYATVDHYAPAVPSSHQRSYPAYA
ncbi:uncharacterized protein JCM15063_000936 [Sporobolomyces koalae]|uniref:uncharacterized protein n=1 Tax=Sporobolomyces koalae TaxID=500713 RepID=UPI003175D5B0